MKKALSLILALVMCLSLCACGGVKLTTAEVEAAFADCDGTLKMETSGDKVTSFTYFVKRVNADSLVDRTYARELMHAAPLGDYSKLTIGQIHAMSAIVPVVSIDGLLRGEGEDENYDVDSYVEEILDIICDGKTAQYPGWTVSATVDQENNSILIEVVSK